VGRRRETELPLEAEVEVDVPFHDADPMGVTWHGNYFRYLESARSALLRKIGYNYAQMNASGYLFPVVEARIKYVKATSFGARLKVRATLEEYENRLKIAYLITDSASGECVTIASTTQVAVRREDGEMCFCSPQILIDQVEACLKSS
jgi:acyl-CoA thioester hydrolase